MEHVIGSLKLISLLLSLCAAVASLPLGIGALVKPTPAAPIEERLLAFTFWCFIFVVSVAYLSWMGA